MLAGTIILSALVILLARALLRWSRLTWPEIAVYLIGVAYMLHVAVSLMQRPPSSTDPRFFYRPIAKPNRQADTPFVG
jgi:hypothetical protein